MKRSGVILLLLVAGALFAQSWQVGPITGFRYWRFDGEYFPGTNKVYFLGGRLSDAGTSGVIWSYDPIARTYANTGVTMPVPVSNYEVSLLLDSFDLAMGDTYGLYIVGGRIQAGTFTNAVQAYYPVSNRVRTITTDTFPCRTGSIYYIPASGPVAANKLYTLGGFQSTASPYTTAQVWVYDPLALAGTRWTQLPNLASARGYISGAVVDSMLYAIGGDTFDGTSLIARRWCERLNLNNPSAGWSRIADLPSPNGDTRAIGFNSDSPYGLAGQIVVAGHGTWSSESVHCYLYNTATENWTSFPSLNQARRNHALAFIPGDTNTGGVPGIWVWGGRYGGDTAIGSSEYYQLNVTGVQEPVQLRPLRAALQVSPNPFRDRVSLELGKTGQPLFSEAEKQGQSRFFLRIFDASGRTIRKLAVLSSGQQTVVWDGCDLTGRPVVKGVYFSRLEGDGVSATEKLVKSE